MPSILHPGQGLLRGQALVSPDGRTELRMTPNGTLVLSNSATGALWTSGTCGPDIARATMEVTGDFVLYHPDGSRACASNTRGNGGASLVVQNDRRAVILRSNGGGSIWEAPPGILHPTN